MKAISPYGVCKKLLLQFCVTNDDTGTSSAQARKASRRVLLYSSTNSIGIKTQGDVPKG